MSDDTLAVLKGTLEFLALRTLAGGAEMHGFEILDFIHRTTDEALQVEEGALYPALHRMEKRGWLTSEWGLSENNRRARYYDLTARGRSRMLRDQRTWSAYAEAVSKVLRAGGSEA